MPNYNNLFEGFALMHGEFESVLENYEDRGPQGQVKVEARSYNDPKDAMKLSDLQVVKTWSEGDFECFKYEDGTIRRVRTA